MTGTWFIGDLHFGHEKVALIRGFSEVDHHDQAIRDRWEQQVSANDVVYVLGDISSGAGVSERKALAIISQLPGDKRLISGNHDSISGVHRKPSPNKQMFREVFEQIHDFGRIRIDGNNILLSHYPYSKSGDGPGRGEMRYAQYRLPDMGELLVHAHTHHTHPTSGSRSGRELCVSWDAWGRMVNIGDVHRWSKEYA